MTGQPDGEVQFCLPELSEGMLHGEIGQWLVAVDDPVNAGQPIVEVLTDKAAVELTSPWQGRISRILWNNGDIVPVGAPLAVLAVTPVPHDRHAEGPVTTPVRAPLLAAPTEPVLGPLPGDTLNTQVLVIGGGPGGYVAAIRLAQLGKRVVLVERQALGGVCLNEGCIPSKALISAAKKVDDLRQAGRQGIRVGDLSIDFPQMQAWKDAIVGKLTGGIAQLLAGNGVHVIRGSAQFRRAHEILVSGPDGERLIVAEDTIIATGSKPVELPGFPVDGRHVLDSTQALSLQEIPDRLLVIGAGYIGLELGTAFAKLGSTVTVIKPGARLLPDFEPAMVQIVSRRLKQLGISLQMETRAKDLRLGPTGVSVTLVTREGETALETDAVLVAAGRRPHTEGLGLEAIGVRLDSKGFVSVDQRQRTSVAHVYAIGDVAGPPMLAHKASQDAEVVAAVIAGNNPATGIRHIPAVAFTDPEIAMVGMTETEAIESGLNPTVGQFPFAANGRALTHGNGDGFVKVIADESSRALLGIHIVGDGASDLISEAALALEAGVVLGALVRTVHPHPTLPEALVEAIRAVTGEAIHQLNA